MPLDIGVGILLAVGISAWLHEPLTLFLLCFAIAAALLPDIDIVTALFGTWRHRGIIHYPIIYVPISAALFILVPFPYALIFTLGVYLHLIHDTIGTGWGIAWLWPFSRRRFLLFPYGHSQEMGTIATWTPEEKPQWSHTGNHSWIRNIYFRPNPVSFVEYGSLLIALLTLGAYLW
jgi:hypothetical protein